MWEAKLERLNRLIELHPRSAWLYGIRAKITRYLIARYGDSARYHHVEEPVSARTMLYGCRRRTRSVRKMLTPNRIRSILDNIQDSAD
ncbi:MAG: hypothetical protein CMJ78_24015 [Planctomycetaceae bacterium]|nr:hypothetical protein [Planctomycetaceae bacterium]